MSNVTPTTPSASYFYSTPEITVNIYPQSGGSMTFNGAQDGVIKAIVDKNIRDSAGGKFAVFIVPGGPNGINDPNTWTNVINMNSLIVISLARAGSKRTVMVGIISEITETQTWNNKQVQRAIKISGQDFTYFFTSFSLYTFTFLGLFSTFIPGGITTYILGTFGLMGQGNPAQVAWDYLNYIMLGVGNPNQPGVLDNTYIFFNGQRFYLRQLFGWWLQSLPVFMPFEADLMNSEGNWLDKFLGFLPWPYYEFFIATAETTDYPQVTSQPSGDFSHAPQSPFNVQGFPNVSPVVIGRVNPQPWIEYPSPPVTTTTTAAQISNSVTPQTSPTVPVLHNYDVWNGLALFSLGNGSFIDSSVTYATDEVANFFGIQTSDTSAIATNSKGGGDPVTYALEILGGVISRYSINTYGFRPRFFDVRWMTFFGALGTANGTSLDVKQTANIMLGMAASFYLPLPLMLKGNVSFPLWPDVLPGTRFQYQPFKNTKDQYMFYIEGVTHTYEYGGRCTTELTLARGLKTTEYGNPNTLAYILDDAYVRQNGTLTPRTDLSTNIPAYHITPASVAGKTGVGYMPWTGPGPIVVSGLKGFPSNATTAYDPFFIAAASATTCGSGQISPNLLKGIAYQESGINNSAINPTTGALGTMQVLPNSTYGNPPQPVNNAELISNPQYNIMVGAQILCDKLNASGGNLYGALAGYGGFVTQDPSQYISQVLYYANTSPPL